MCLLIVVPEDAKLPVEHIREAAITNNDGYGWATLDKSSSVIITYKSMSLDDAIKRWESTRATHGDKPAIWHLRIATHGVVDAFNCHPFYVGNDNRTVLAHNGILPVHPEKHDPRSDTHVLAQDIIPELGLHCFDDDEWTAEMEKWMGMGNKVAILSVDPTLKKYLYILNEKVGDWHDGVWYSNNSWKPWSGYNTRAWGYDSDWNDWSPRTSIVSGRSYTRVTIPADSPNASVIDRMPWPASQSAPQPSNGYNYTSAELMALEELDCTTSICSFCGGDIGYEYILPDECPICSMDPLQNVKTRREMLDRADEEPGDRVLLTTPSGRSETEHVINLEGSIGYEENSNRRFIFPPSTVDAKHLPGTIYYRHDGAYVWDGEAFVQYLDSDGDFADFREVVKAMAMERLISAASEPTDDVVFAQATTDADFLKHEEARVPS